MRKAQEDDLEKSRVVFWISLRQATGGMWNRSLAMESGAQEKDLDLIFRAAHIWRLLEALGPKAARFQG